MELFSIMITDFSENRGTTKKMVIMYYLFMNVWKPVFAIVYILGHKWVDRRKWLLIVLILTNLVILLMEFPIFFAYFGL